MKVLVTGATSTIGNHLVKFLLEDGYHIHILVRDLEKAKYFDNSKIKLFEGDIDSEFHLNRAIEGCDYVFHLAALTKVWVRDPSKYYKVNVQGAINVLKAGKANGVKRVVITSSAGGYGPSINGSINEENVREMGFFNDYECSKVMCELKAKEFSINHNFDVVFVAPSRVYGPTLNAEISSTTLLFDQFINHSWRLIPGKGKELGNYAYIEDVAKGHILAMLHGKAGESYILGGHNISYNTFFEILSRQSNIHRKMIHTPYFLQNLYAYSELYKAKFLGKAPKITPQWLAKGKFYWEVDSSKAVNELGYQLTPIDQAFDKTIAFVKGKKKA